MRVDDVFHHFVHTDFVVAHLFNQFENFGNRSGAGGDGLNHVAQGGFDFFGDNDFVFAREQIHLPHFAHIHAYRVGGAAEFGVGAGKGGFGFGNSIVVGHVGRVVGHQQGFAVGRFFGYLNAQAGNHIDDIVDLFGIRHIVGQGIVDFGVGDVAAFFTLQNQLSEPCPLLLRGERAVAFVLFFGGGIVLFGHVSLVVHRSVGVIGIALNGAVAVGGRTP